MKYKINTISLKDDETTKKLIDRSIEEYKPIREISTIGDYAFADCTFSEFVVPDTVNKIGKGILLNCNNLTTLRTPFIGDAPYNDGNPTGTSRKTFLGYFFDRSVYNSQEDYIPSSLTNLEITQGTDIGDHAFDGCSNITNITLNDETKYIGWYAFYGCSALKNITLPSNLTTIKGRAFYGSGLKTIIIPDSVTTIGDYAFADCENMWKATIGSGIINIPNYMFFSCGSLTTVIFPSTLQKIGKNAFYSCDLLSVELPEGVTTLGQGCFNYNKRLYELYLPKSLKTIESMALANCSNLKTINYSGTKSQWNAINIASDADEFTYVEKIKCSDGDIIL